MQSIDRLAFEDCSGLQSITIPAGVTEIASSAFSSCQSLREITFEGNAPQIASDAFKDVSATAYYPAGNTTWNADTKLNYGGNITWVAYGDAQDNTCGENLTWELDENGVPKHYTRVLRGDACAYSGGVGTYTGAKLLQAGTVAVNPDIIPFGSKLFIVADNGFVYGYAEATDSGTAVMENLILVDLHMPTYNQCRRFGRHTVTVYFLE